MTTEELGARLSVKEMFMDSMTQKAYNEIYRLLKITKQGNSRELHLRAWETAVRLEVPEHHVWQALAWFSTAEGMRLATWSNWLRREVTFQEWPTSAFFNNGDDCNYVRLRPAEA
jgi:hypothetical protein